MLLTTSLQIFFKIYYKFQSNYYFQKYDTCYGNLQAWIGLSSK